MRMEIHLRNGQSFQVDADEIATGQVAGTRTLEWVTPDHWARKLHHIDLGEVIAIVAVRDDEPLP